MRWFSGFSTLVFAGALLTSPAYAHDRSARAPVSDPYLALLQSYGEELVVVVGLPATDGLERASIDGQVAALDHERGRLVLDTDDGLVSVVTSPGELTNIEVGDVVRVSFMMND
jgi:hypothetical protein